MGYCYKIALAAGKNVVPEIEKHFSDDLKPNEVKKLGEFTLYLFDWVKWDPCRYQDILAIEDVLQRFYSISAGSDECNPANGYKLITICETGYTSADFNPDGEEIELSYAPDFVYQEEHDDEESTFRIETAARAILDKFDKFLANRNVRIPTSDAETKKVYERYGEEFDGEEPRLYGNDYNELFKVICENIRNLKTS